MEEEAHVGNDDMVDVCKKFVGGMISELARSEGIESADASEESAFLCQFFIDEAGDRPQGHEPSPLNIVHLLE